MKTEAGPSTAGLPHLSWFQLGNCLLAFCGKGGDQGVFRLLRNKPGSKWEFCPPRTREWDSYHQSAFRGSRADTVHRAKLDNVPPLPSTFPPPRRIWVGEPPRDEAPRSRDNFHRAVVEAGGEIPLWIVLEEDTYETYYGDGCFREFSGAFRTEEEARKAAAAAALHTHIRKARLVAKGDHLSLVIPATDKTHFDHVTLKQVCDALAGTARKKAGRKKVSR
jgi:hypothetical protein